MNFLKTVIILIFFFLYACSSNNNVDTTNMPDDLLFMVGEIPVTEDLLDYYAMNVAQTSVMELSDAEREMLLSGLVQTIQIANDAINKNLPSIQPSLQAELDFLRIQSLAMASYENFIIENAPTDNQLEALFAENIDQFSSDQYKARHILVETEDEANEIIRDLDNGADFIMLAEEFSIGPSAPNGGDLGWFGPNTMVAPFSLAVQAMDIGDYSDVPVQTQFGFHVILLEDKETGDSGTYENYRDELINLYQQSLLGDYLQDMALAYPRGDN